jgi:uncharacterized protein (TIGR02444 family)
LLTQYSTSLSRALSARPGRDMRHRPADQAEAFWRFSLAFYTRVGVTAALLELQDRHRCDVNLILWALWQGAIRGQRLMPVDFAAAEGAIGGLHGGVVKPLRRLRRTLSSATDADAQKLRRRIAAVELAAERRVQARLATLIPEQRPPCAERVEAALANLVVYLGPHTAGLPPALRVRAELAGFLRR